MQTYNSVNKTEQNLTFEIPCVDGVLTADIPLTQLETSSILKAIIIDLGCNTGESLPIPCFTELTQLEAQAFICAWLETIPDTTCTAYTNPPEYTINSHPVICPTLESVLTPNKQWLDYLAEHKLYGEYLQKYNMKLIAKYTKPANFLDLQSLLSLFKFILAKQYRELSVCYSKVPK
jgi:hypothetical protein